MAEGLIEGKCIFTFEKQLTALAHLNAARSLDVEIHKSVRQYHTHTLGMFIDLHSVR